MAALPPDESHLPLKKEFLAAYHRINLAYARLVAWRRKAGSDQFPAHERRLLQAIERAIVARERLEDRVAARGVTATPMYRDGFTVDVQFQFPDQRRAESVTVLSSASCALAFPRRPARR